MTVFPFLLEYCNKTADLCFKSKSEALLLKTFRILEVFNWEHNKYYLIKIVVDSLFMNTGSTMYNSKVNYLSSIALAHYHKCQCTYFARC